MRKRLWSFWKVPCSKGGIFDSELDAPKMKVSRGKWKLAPAWLGFFRSGFL